jgi:hypothetical protein
VAADFGATVESLAGLDAAERARIAAHVAALVEASPKRRAAILGLTEAT